MPNILEHDHKRCLVPSFDRSLFSQQWKDALWNRFFTGALARQRRSVERFSISREPESVGQVPWHQPQDCRQMEEAHRCQRSADRPEGCQVQHPDDRGGSDHRRLSAAHATAARRLPLCAISDDPAPDAILAPSMLAASRHCPAKRPGWSAILAPMENAHTICPTRRPAPQSKSWLERSRHGGSVSRPINNSRKNWASTTLEVGHGSVCLHHRQAHRHRRVRCRAARPLCRVPLGQAAPAEHTSVPQTCLDL
jgi:hypothetical protein